MKERLANMKIYAHMNDDETKVKWELMRGI